MASPTTAFAEVYSAHAHEIQRYCRRMVHNHETAEDLAQDTFVNAWQAFAAFDGTNPRGWLYRIARNVCLRHLEKAKDEISIDAEDAQELIQPDSSLELVVLTVSANKLIASMPAEQGSTVLLRVAGLTLREMSECMGKIAVSTVASRLHSAQADLGRALL